MSPNKPNSPSKLGQQPAAKPQGVAPTGQQFLIKGEIHTGPIPSPETIAGYEKILPGAADRIIKMAEREQNHRHQLDTRDQRYRVLLTFAGQVFAFFIGVSGVVGGVYLVRNDKSLVGFSVFFTSLAALSGVYLYNRRQSTTRAPQQINKHV